MKKTLIALAALLALPSAALASGGSQPVPTTPPAVASVSFAPSDTVVGGGSVTGTFRFTSIPDGAVVRFASSDPAVAQVPAQVVVGRVISGTFGVTTSAVT